MKEREMERKKVDKETHERERKGFFIIFGGVDITPVCWFFFFFFFCLFDFRFGINEQGRRRLSSSTLIQREGASWRSRKRERGKEKSLFPFSLLGGGLALLAEEHRVDVGEDTARGDGHARQQLGELLVVADGELDVAGHDAGLLVVARGVAGELQDLGGQVLQHGGEVDGGARADPRRVLALLQVAGDAANRELEAGLGRLGDGLLAGGLAFAAARHCEVLGVVGGGGGGRRMEDGKGRVVSESMAMRGTNTGLTCQNLSAN